MTTDLKSSSSSSKDERKLFPFLVANFSTNSTVNYSNCNVERQRRQQCRPQSPRRRNAVNFLRFVANYTSDDANLLDVKNYCDDDDDSSSCANDRMNVDANHDLNKTFLYHHYPPQQPFTSSSMTSRLRFLPFLSSLLFCFTLFLLSSTSIVDAQGSNIKPANVTFGRSGAHYMRFNDGKSSRVIVEIVLNISESTPVGTPITYLQAYDKQPGDLAGTNYTFVITHESDVYRQFSIGNQDGILRVAKPLDREVIPVYRLFIKAIDESGNEGKTVININLGDVNDNAPYLNLSKQLIIWENDPPAFIGIVTAYDPDGPDNGPPFYMVQADNSTYKSLINVVFDQPAFNGNGAINVSSIKTLDREGAQGKFLYVPIYVRDNKGFSAIRYLPIEIGDRNDNSMTDGSSTIHVYNYNGEMPETIIGRVYVTDLDDWDVVDKSFVWATTPPSYFTLTTDGLIVIKTNAPVGTYTLSVSVTDNVRHETATGSVTVQVEYIDDYAIQNSGSIRIRGMSAERFLRPYNSTASPYERLRTALAGFLLVDVSLVQIFTILPVQPADQLPPIIDVYFSVRRAANQVDYLSPIYLTGVVEQKRIEIEASFYVSNVQIIQVNIDPCIQEMCTEGGCTRLMNVNATPSVIMANRTSLVGVNLNVTTSCQCPREIATQQCTSDSCYNGGICHNAQSGYFCECRGSYNNGSRCEGRTRNFNSGGYAWLKPIGSCNNFSISLEFMTKSTNATLLFNGPMQSGRDNDVYIPDFIAVLLVNGRLTVQVNLGGGTTTFQFNNTATPMVNDGEWHVVDIIASQRDFEIILDRCRNMSSANNKTALQSCRVAGVAIGSNEQLNVDDPLQIGGVAAVDGAAFNLTLVKDSLVGCLRNLVVNGELYDVHGVVTSENSDVGCSLTNQYCLVNGVPVCLHGECVASLSGVMRCVCDIGWYGDVCDQATQWKTFSQSSYVQYNFAGALSQTYNKIQILFLPTRVNQGYLQYAGIYPPSQAQNYLGIDIFNGNVEFDYNFGSGQMSIQPPAQIIASNISYFVEVDRYWTYSRITIDGLSDPYAAFRVGSPDELGWMTYSPLNFFLGAASKNPSSDDFQGCIKEFVFNDMYVPITDNGKYSSVVNQQGVSDGCSAFGTCATLSCSSGYVCVEFWKGAFCTCPPSLPPLIGNDGTLRGCGTNAAALHLGITRGAIAAILISLLALILLVLLLVIWRCRKQDKTMPDDELIGDVRDYREEGGGEEDQENYNIGPLRKPVMPTMPTEREIQDVQKLGGAPNSITPVVIKPKSTLKPDGDLDAFILGKIADAEHDPTGPPYDELRVYAVEFDGISVCSLSSLESAGSDIDWDELNEWGPRFRHLADLYGGEDDD